MVGWADGQWPPMGIVGKEDHSPMCDEPLSLLVLKNVTIHHFVAKYLIPENWQCGTDTKTDFQPQMGS